jgi:hypothetical protein
MDQFVGCVLSWRYICQRRQMTKVEGTCCCVMTNVEGTCCCVRDSSEDVGGLGVVLLGRIKGVVGIACKTGVVVVVVLGVGCDWADFVLEFG